MITDRFNRRLSECAETMRRSEWRHPVPVRVAAGFVLGAILVMATVACQCRCALGNEQLLARRGGQHHRADGLPGAGVRALDPRQPLSARPGALGADRDGEPAQLPGRLRRHRRVRGRVLVHQLRPVGRLRARGRPERRGLRLRAGAGDHLAGDRGDHGQAAGARAVGQRPQPEQLRDPPRRWSGPCGRRTTAPAHPSAPPSAPARASSRTTPPPSTAAAPRASATRRWPRRRARWRTRSRSTSTTPGRP